MKKRIISVLCIMAILCMAMTGVTFADGAYKTSVSVCVTSDSQTIEIGSSLPVNSDGSDYWVSPTSYCNIVDLEENDGTIILDGIMRIKSGATYGTIWTRGTKSEPWNHTSAVSGIYSFSWEYVRIIYDFGNKTVSTYTSSDGWGSLAVRKPDGVNAVSFAGEPTGIGYIKFDNLDIKELHIYQGGTAPSATASIIKTGNVLTASYNYSDAQGDAEAGVAYNWQISADNSAWTDIQGANQPELAVTSDYYGKYIRCLVIVKASRYPSESAVAESNSILCEEPKVYSSFKVLDFENEDPVADSTYIDGSSVGDTTNPTVYKAASGNYDVPNLNIVAENVVIDFRAKRHTNTWHTINAIFNKWNGLNVAWNMDGSTAGYREDWTYYRMVINSKDATAVSDVEVQLFTSPDKKAWTRVDHTKLPANKFSVNNSNTTGYNPLTQLRFNGCYLDDINVYMYGSAPVADNAVISQSLNVLTASFDYSDPENDAQGTHQYQWQYSSDNNDFANIAGATGKTYTITGDEYSDGYYRCVITPVSTGYPCDGENVETDPVYYEKYSIACKHVNSLGEEVDSYDLNDSFKTIFTITNNSGEEMPVTLFTAIYDKSDKRLLSVNMNPGSVVSDGSPHTLEISAVYPDDEDIPADGTHMKVFMFNNESDITPYIPYIPVFEQGTAPTLYLVGDSVCAEYDSSKYPMQGWGHYIGNYLNGVAVSNRAHPGWTTDHYLYPDTKGVTEAEKGYYTWDNVKNSLKNGDYVLIALGINDSNTTSGNTEEKYTQNLQIMYDDVISMGATPIFLTPTIYGGADNDKWSWASNLEGRWYVRGQVCKVFAQSKGAVCLELGDAMYDLYNEMYAGYKQKNYPDNNSDEAVIASRNYVRHYFHLYASALKSEWNMNDEQITSLLKGNDDQTHLNEKGAERIAALIASLIKSSDVLLADYVK